MWTLFFVLFLENLPSKLREFWPQWPQNNDDPLLVWLLFSHLWSYFQLSDPKTRERKVCRWWHLERSCDVFCGYSFSHVSSHFIACWISGCLNFEVSGVRKCMHPFSQWTISFLVFIFFLTTAFFPSHFPLPPFLGSYMIVISSDHDPGEKTRLQLPTMKENDTHCIDFSYLLYSKNGGNPGTLNILVRVNKGPLANPIWNVTGSTGKDWLRAELAVSTFWPNEYQVNLK